MFALARQEDGQAIVVVALAMVVLMGALLLGVDWGYRLATSRTTQNQADSAALAAGRALATRYGGAAFDLGGQMTQEDVWSVACRARNANSFGAPADAALTLTVSFFADDGTTGLGDVASSDATENAACALSTSTDVDASTRYVRVLVDARFSSLFGMVTRQELRALSVARARLAAGAAVRPLVLPPVTQPGDVSVGTPGLGLSGYTTKPNAAVWPIVIRAGDPWATSSTRNVSLIHHDVPADSTYYVSLAHYSPHEGIVGRTAHQLVTESDYSATTHREHGHYDFSAPVANRADAACGVTWDSFGPTIFGSTPLEDAGRCSVPNWFNYGFRGSIGVTTDWNGGSWDDFMSHGNGTERPELTSPGDWLETIPASDVDIDIAAAAMRRYVSEYGRDVPGSPGDKAVVINIFVWDCGESFNAAGTDGHRWNLNGTTSTCASSAATPDRVHVASVVPVTIALSGIRYFGPHYDVDGTWGGVFGDAGTCEWDPTVTGCALNQFINSAFLVPEE